LIAASVATACLYVGTFSRWVTLLRLLAKAAVSNSALTEIAVAVEVGIGPTFIVSLAGSAS
jgi:hypothetical protein